MSINTTDKVCFITFGKRYGKACPGADGAKIVKSFFQNVEVVPFSPDETEHHDPEREQSRKVGVRKLLDTLEYDYLISYWGFLYLRSKDFVKATKGAINFHPCPPEAPGLACYVFPMLHPEQRNIGGVTVHEVNRKFDNGTIYQAMRFPINAGMSGQELVAKSMSCGLEALTRVCEQLSLTGCHTSALMRPECVTERWGDRYFSGEFEKELIRDLPCGHPIRELNLFDGKYIYNDPDAPLDEEIVENYEF